MNARETEHRKRGPASMPSAFEHNTQLAVRLRSAHALCDEYGDVASASLIENWINEAEHRTWLLYEATRLNPEN